ncbi:M20/M25/M40 family metallo-hydrolase [Marinobacter sp. HL-58]|uniref:M20/M25/M40 family metallo-hydrolase n=1 Tax=Marinobacter sp. HL-58 TaxID=1479237 RepID=UPI00047FEC2A|nr:M20/M25/M40 family metallo-hydrolase [Marinobacter sp. HL-58]KPQ01671.1 MAG: putative deacylase [Marinobacter sp. HL-58]
MAKTIALNSPYTAASHDQVGSIPHIMGPWQLDLLQKLGLKKNSRVADIGCGTLRGGLHIIGYLDPGHYFGVDPLVSLVKVGRGLVEEAGLSYKNPLLGSMDDLQGVERRSVDFVLTQSVLNHLDAKQIETVVAQVNSVLATGGQWILTARISDLVDQVDEGVPHPTRPNERLDSVMGRAWFQRVLYDYGMVMEPVVGHIHPRGLDVACVRRLDSQIAPSIEQTLDRLVQWDTSPHGEDHQQTVAWLEAFVTALDFEVLRYGDSPTPLLIARRAPKGGSKRRLVMYNHYDVEEVQNGWKSPPFELTTSRGRWFGLGVADNKGALAVRLEAMRNLDSSPELWWFIQGEEESGSKIFREYVQENGLPEADWFLDENGKTGLDGNERLLSFCQLPEGKRQALTPERQAVVERSTQLAGEQRMVDVRPLDKRFVRGGCVFQQGLPPGACYLGLGTNDGETHIHAPNESIPIEGAVKHWIQVRSLLKAAGTC